MSTLLKKKGAASFKPRAPVRRPTTAPPSKTPSIRPSIERESQPPAPSSAQDTPVPSIERESNEVEAQVPALPEQSTVPAVTETAPSPPPSIQAPRPEASGDIPTQARPKAASELPTPLATAPVIDKTAAISPHPAPAEGTSSVALPSPPSIPAPGAITKKPLGRARRGRPSATKAQQALPQEISPEDDATVSDEATPSQAIPKTDDVLPSIEANDKSRDLSAKGAGESDRPSEVVLTAPLDADGTSGTPVPSQTVKATARARKRKIADADVDPTVQGQAPKIKAARKTPVPRKPRKPREVDPDAPPKSRRKRAETPEDAEDQEIDHSTVKMAELCRDLKIGKKFSKHDEIKRRDLERKAKAKLRRENPELVEDSDENEWRPRTRVPSEAPPADVSLAGPRMRLVDGQIVIDETSLNLDRHKIAAATAGVMEIVEENEFTRITTSGTYMKREKNVFWDMEAEEKFYTGLRMFGTDFEMISKMFRDRSRRHIKLKFNKEEKLFPSKINSALLGEKVPIDFEEYKSHTGLEYEDVAVINAEREEIEAEQNAEEARIEAELAETVRQKKAAIHGFGGGSGKENDEAGNAKSRKKGKAKKNKASVFGGGEEVEILGDI